MTHEQDRDALAEVLADDALIEAVGAAIWQANNELTKPEYRNMPDAEARAYFAHAAIDAAFASDWLAQRDRRVAAAVLREMGAKFRTEARETWGGDVGWTTTGSKVAVLAASWCAEEADRIEARP